MRTIIDLPERQITALDRLSKAKKVSRAEVIRQAVVHYLTDHAPERAEAFGLWKRAGFRQDGVAYQRRLRREWGG